MMMHWLVAAALALPAPLPPAPTPDTTLPERERVMHVPAELREQLRAHVIDKARSQAQRFDLLVAYTFEDHGLALAYDNGITRTVEEAWRTRRVNCLSFSLLFTAMAREVGLDARVQEIDRVLVWYEQQGIIYNSGHVNVGVRIGSRRPTVDVARNAVIARHRPEPISDDRALAHFYNNRGAELMEAGELAAARRHMEEAIALDPEYATSWSNYGVVHMRTGQLQAAEQAYLWALSLDPEHAPALYNIVGLYHRNGDAQRRAEFQTRLEQAQLADPFHQFLLANDYEGRGEYPRAVEHYRRAIRLHGNEHRFYFGLARTYLLMGETRRASRALGRARALGDDDSRRVYQAKLDLLRHGSER